MIETTEHTEKKRLEPELRFKEFDEVWKKHTLKELLSSLVDCEHKTAPYVEESEYLVVRTNNVKKGQLDYEEIKYTTKEGFEEWTKRSVPKFGDILFTREAPAGESCLVPDNKKVCLGQRMVLLKPNEKKMTGQYLSSYLQSDNAIRDISNLSIGTTVTRINIADIYKLKCPISSIPEQQKIATFLTAVDSKLQQFNTKKTLLEQYKKGVMQQLFSQNLRFKDDDGRDYADWEEKTLGEVAIVTMGQSPASSSYNDKEDGVYLIQGNADINGRITNPRQWTNEPTKKCESGDLIMTVRAPVGTISKSLHNACIGRGVCSIRNKKTSNIEFLYQFLIDYEQKWIRLEQGSTFTAVSGSDIKTIKVYHPSIKEQQKIANYLSAIDSKIELVSQQIEKTQTFKKGLLQGMFV